LIVGVLFLLFLFIGFLPQIFHLLVKPTGAWYPWVHNYIADYYYYLSFIEQIREGNWVLTSRYTTEFFQGQWVNQTFMIMGWFAGITHVSTIFSYHFFRALFSSAVFFGVYYLSRLVFSRSIERVATLFLFIFFTPFVTITNSTIGIIGAFWTGFDPIDRQLFLPHHALAVALGILLFILVFFLTKKKPSFFMTLGIVATSIMMTFANPIVALFCGITLFLTVTIHFLSFRKNIVPLVFLFGSIGIVLLYLFRVSSSTFPWIVMGNWERYVQHPLDVATYIWLLGITGFFACVGFALALKKREFLWTVIAIWFLLPAVALLIEEYIPLSNVRLVQGYPWIAAQFLTVLTISTLIRRFGGKWKYVIGTLIGIFLCISFVPAWIISLQTHTKQVTMNQRNLLVYVPRVTRDVLTFLASHGKREEGVLADDSVLTLLPAFTDKRAWFSHPILTFDNTRKAREAMDVLIFDSEETMARMKASGVRWIVVNKARNLAPSLISSFSLEVQYENDAYWVYYGGEE